MRGVVYVSEARVYFDTISLESLAADAASRNLESGITGYLYFEKDRFVQYIEGDDEAVDALMGSIRRDRRHRVIHELATENLEQRRFPSWHMRHLRRKELARVEVENVLTDYLLFLDPSDHVAPPSEVRWENLVWGMVSRLSDVRSKLGSY
jgi:hypothetical protein